MAIDFDPIVGNWYEHADKGQKFEVVTIDEDSGIVEIQYYDGDIEEMDYEAWYELNVEPTEPPDDWIGPGDDDFDDDDLDYSEPEPVETSEEPEEETPRRGRRAASRRRKGDDDDEDEVETEDEDYGNEDWEE